MLGGRSLVGDPPNRAASVVAEEERAVLGDGERGRAAPDLGALLARSPKAGREVFVIAFGPAVLKWHAYNFVSGRFGTVPRSFHRDKEAPLKLGWELVGLIE